MYNTHVTQSCTYVVTPMDGLHTTTEDRQQTKIQGIFPKTQLYVMSVNRSKMIKFPLTNLTNNKLISKRIKYTTLF